MSPHEGRQELLSPPFTPTHQRRNLPSTTPQQKQGQQGERQEQRMEQSQEAVRGPPVRHGYLSSSSARKQRRKNISIGFR